jgi:hypothetical protein
VQRSNSSCAADLEGGLADIVTSIDIFVPFGSPTVIADSARNAFFIADLRFGIDNDFLAVGVVRTTRAVLLSGSTCPNGTETNSAACWPTAGVANITGLNNTLSNPHIAVDPRISGTGAGDVYMVVTQQEVGAGTHIALVACTNAALDCGNPITISGADTEADLSFVQVRPDGGITVSYRDTTFPGINPEEIKFVTCTPNGAPKPPTCAGALTVTTESQPVFASLIGNTPMTDATYPRHVHRLESDGVTVTTFLVYDRCDAAVVTGLNIYCPKNDVVLTTSQSNGASWSPIAKVTNSAGQQFFSTIANDQATGTVNIAYYSTENDPFSQRPQVLLVQVEPGATTPGAPRVLTTANADPQSSSPLIISGQPQVFGDRLGVAAAGTGIAGDSRAYVGFAWNSVAGTYNGVLNPDINNQLIRLTY